ncbi:histidine phosphotransferase family protein [uncultured Lentibacter sp.]|jgi:histidine phosphotransferase ChpT|uniref:histidine phosphotransferase family protein n=1 Tax=uncultured Lentibacter sp. TaxID=1659309 RepID=UPI00260B687C|nr:histidine phosphotransferase family protein [uncultured Lentibacter sp.]
MAQDRLTLARLIGSRLCHDLISPIGAIANGMELVALSGAPQSPELELINASVAGATARIRFYRIALGMSSGEQRLGASELRRILDDYYRDTRLRCTWELIEDAPRNEVQAAFLALLCLGTALPLGGTMQVQHSAQAGWTVQASGQLRLEPALWEMLNGAKPPEDLEPAQVQFAMLPECTSALHRQLHHHKSEDQLTISF